MPFTAQDLIEDQPKPVWAKPDTSVEEALKLMIENDFSQLPILDEERKVLGLVTSDSILRGVSYFRATLDKLRVQDVEAIEKVSKYSLDDSIFDLLDGLNIQPAVLIVDSQDHLIGIVTAWDTTNYFRRRAEDMMLVEDIEVAVREHITTAFTDPATGELDQTALQATMENAGIKKDFDRLSLYQYTRLLVAENTWKRYGSTFSVGAEHIKRLLDSVRQMRNMLAHFRGEISNAQRHELRFCAKWLQQCLPTVDVETMPEAMIVTEAIGEDEIAPLDEEVRTGESRYAPLAMYLYNQPSKTDRLQLTFEGIEAIIDSELPPSARQHRSWWANDSVGHVQSMQWLGAGWRTSSINMGAGTVVFTRIKEREKAYIDFFSTLLLELRQKADFPVRDESPTGRSWINVKPLAANGRQRGLFAIAFTHGKQIRVELYIDTGEQDPNKQIFDKLYKQRDEIETDYDAPLTWERLDNRRASRIAAYHDGSIDDSEAELAELREWAIVSMIRFHRAVSKKADVAAMETWDNG
jgi:CBS domain-containing protein